MAHDDRDWFDEFWDEHVDDGVITFDSNASKLTAKDLIEAFESAQRSQEAE